MNKNITKLVTQMKKYIKNFINKHILICYSAVYILGVASLTLLIVLVKKLSKTSGINIFEILFIREGFIVLFLIPFMIKERFNLFKADNFKIQLARHGLFAFSSFFWYSGVFLSPVNEMVAFAFISQILASIFAGVILKEKLSKVIPFCIFISFIGVFIMQAHKISINNLVSSNISVKGYIFCFIAIIARGFIPILNKILANTSRVSHTNYMTHIIFFVASAFFIKTFKTFSVNFIPLLLLCGFLYLLENYCLIIANKHIPVYFLQLLDFLKIVFSIIFSNVFLDEDFTVNQIIGGCVIFLSYFIATRYKIKTKK